MTDQQLLTELKGAMIRVLNIRTMMRKGAFIPADEKLAGVYSRLDNIALAVQTRIAQCKPSTPPSSPTASSPAPATEPPTPSPTAS